VKWNIYIILNSVTSMEILTLSAVSFLEKMFA